MFSVSIIGVGKMGGALAIALDQKGFKIKYLVGKTVENTEKISLKLQSKPQLSDEIKNLDSDIILITTQDSEIANVAQLLVNAVSKNQFIFHTSGSLSSEILNCLKAKGCEIGSFHPLVSISDAIIGATRFKDSYFCLEGSEKAVNMADTIVTALEGKSFSIETKHKTLYHASAVTACGHFVALFSIAIEMLSKCGLSEKDAKQILLPLVNSTLENLSNQTTKEALTGTFARGDVEILNNQIEVLSKNMPPQFLQIYLQLGLQSLNINESAPQNKIEKMKELIETFLIAKN